MHPVLLKLGRLEIYAYGVALAISFLLGIYWAIHRAEKRGIRKDDVMDLSILVVISAIVGSRFLYVVTHLDEFHGHWLDTISPFQSTGAIGIAGLSMLGGVVMAILVVMGYCLSRKISILRLFDVFAPSFALGIFITRIGCFMNGCCFGKACDLPWAVTFPVISPAGATLPGVHIHPTQLYSSLYGLVILLVLYFLDRRPRFDGFLGAMFFILYGLSRFLVDFVRYYEESVQVNLGIAVLTINQVISLLMILTGGVMLLLLSRRK